MRPATYYYLAQAWARTRQTQSGAPFALRARGRHARPPRRDRLGGGLPAVRRRVLALLNGTSQAA
jgi:hypothetical protein